MSANDLAVTLNAPDTGVIITGGASGIGLASARALAAVGRPVALWDINTEKAEKAANTIATDYGVTTIGVGIDLTDLGLYDEAIQRTRKAIGKLGGLVHSAGTVDTGSLEGITEDSWNDGINVHLRPLAILVQRLYQDFASNPDSAIVAIASINATLGNAVNPIYSAAKGGMLSLVRSLADRIARDGIRINSVSPGQIKTPMLAPSMEQMADSFNKRILLERVGDPEEIGRVVRFLLSKEASYITASEVVVDGGNLSSQRY